MKIYEVIQKSVTTEKSSIRQSDNNTYTFNVRRDVTKVDVQNAIKTIYGVDVEKVQMMIAPAKTKMAGRGIATKRAVQKKAIVRIKKGQTLDLNKFKDVKTK